MYRSGVPAAIIPGSKKDLTGFDFENNPDNFACITDKIDAQLFGLFK